MFFTFLLDDEVDRSMLDAMLQSSREHTPVLVVNAIRSTGSTDIHMPVLVADKLRLCKLANHPWQVCDMSSVPKLQ